LELPRSCARQALLTPGGRAPDQASSSNRAGAVNHERTGRSKARKQVIPGVTPAVTNPQPSTIRLRRRSSQSFRRGWAIHHRDLGAATAP
jgi:hypothetical protein